MRKAAITALTAASVFGVTTFAVLAASPFEGVWKVKDTSGPLRNHAVQQRHRKGYARRRDDRHLEGAR
jgi:hypothetical protein